MAYYKFSTKRGRPRKILDCSQNNHDNGTPELQRKIIELQTKEPIDLLLEKRLISNDEHRAAMHFRWLYTLRYGIPSVRAIDTTRIYGIDRKLNDEEWLTKREEEYKEATEILKKANSLSKVINIVIHNAFPDYLKPQMNMKINKTALKNEKSLLLLKEGLSSLADNWF